MAWLPTGLTAIVVCDHGSVKPTGVRAGAGRCGHLPATTAEVRATAMPKVHRHAQVLQCVERPGSPAAEGRRVHSAVRPRTVTRPETIESRGRTISSRPGPCLSLGSRSYPLVQQGTAVAPSLGQIRWRLGRDQPKTRTSSETLPVAG